MNTVKAIIPQAETKAAVSQPKAQKQAGGDFMEMLSGAMTTEKMKNAAVRQEVTGTKPENAAQTADKTVNAEPDKTLRDKAATDVKDALAEAQEAEPDEIAIANAAVQMQIQVPVMADILPDVQDMTGTVPVQASGQPAQTAQTILPVQPEARTMPVQAETGPQAETAQVQPEAEYQTQVAQVQDMQTGERTADAQTLHTQTENQQSQVQAVNAEQPKHTARAQRKQATAQERTAERESPEQAANTVKAVQTEQRPVSGEQTGRDVSGESTKQPGEGFQTQTARQAIRQVDMKIRQTGDPEQARFDGMLAKARQELVYARTGTAQEPPVITEKTAQAVDELETPLAQEMPEAEVTPATPVTPETEVTPATQEQEAAVETEQIIPEENAEVRQTDETNHAEVKHEAKPAETKHESWRTESVRTHVPEIREQKPVKTERKVRDEEVAANAVQPKAQQISSPERPHIERQAPAQAVRTPDQSEQIRAQVVRNLEEQKMEFNMQLHPQDLGKVNVKMVLEGGKLAVEIMAANAKSAEILNKQTEALVSSLRMGNLEVTSVNVVTAGQNASSFMDGEYNLNNYNGQADRQDAQSSKAGANGQNGGGEKSGQPDEEAEVRQPRGILNYSI